MDRLWPLLLPIGGVGWWLLGFPPGWGWLVLPMVPQMPVSLGMVIVLGLVVLGLWQLARTAVDNL
jgi:hypothetical protein